MPNELRISVCICTMNRPQLLERALNSIPLESEHILEVLVSDDGQDDRSRRVVERFGAATWIAGPRRGAAANRNNVALHAAGSHVWFLDDDAMPSLTCLQRFLACLQRVDALDRTILTGLVDEYGTLVEPHEQSFLGFQSKSYGPSERLQTVVLPNAIFPRSLFDQVCFDEALPAAVYEEVDLTTRAVAEGYEIRLCRDAVAKHEASREPDRYGREIHVARIYVTAKRYAFTDHQPLKAALLLFVAIGHMIASEIKRGGLVTIGGSLVSVAEVASRLYRYARYRRPVGTVRARRR
jgi:glycosyltransferase involved in cell wall biosynthesis